MFSSTPDFRRLETTLHHQEPDRVPLVEAAVDYEIMGQFLGRPVSAEDLPAQVMFWSRAGYDYIPFTVAMMSPGAVTQDSQISKTLRDVVLKDAADREDGWNLERRSFIRTEADFESFPWDEAARPDISPFYRIRDYLPEGMKVIALSGKIFTLSWMLMGFENFAISSVTYPALVERLVEKVARIQLAGLREVARLPYVAAAWAVDDLAFGTGPMIHPRAFRKLIFPWYEEFARICRERGLYFIFHSDGVLWNLLEELIGLGVRALHPIDPTCMDINLVKEKVGRRLCLLGNISNEILMTGTPTEVACLTRKNLKEIAPGGGYGLGAGNSVPHWTKFENYAIMHETVLEYGGYPIQIP